MSCAFSVVCRQTIRVSVVSVRPLKRKRKKRTKFQPGDLVRRWSLPEVQWHLAPSSWMSEKKKKKTWITKTPMGGIIIRKWKDPGQLLALRAVYDALVTSTSSLPFRRRRVRETRRTRRTMVDLPTAFPENFFFLRVRFLLDNWKFQLIESKENKYKQQNSLFEFLLFLSRKTPLSKLTVFPVLPSSIKTGENASFSSPSSF